MRQPSCPAQTQTSIPPSSCLEPLSSVSVEYRSATREWLGRWRAVGGGLGAATFGPGGAVDRTLFVGPFCSARRYSAAPAPNNGLPLPACPCLPMDGRRSCQVQARRRRLWSRYRHSHVVAAMTPPKRTTTTKRTNTSVPGDERGHCHCKRASLEPCVFNTLYKSIHLTIRNPDAGAMPQVFSETASPSRAATLPKKHAHEAGTPSYCTVGGCPYRLLQARTTPHPAKMARHLPLKMLHLGVHAILRRAA